MIKYRIVITCMCFTIAAVLPVYGQQQKENSLGILWSKVAGYYPGIGAKQSAVDASKLHERAVKSEMLPQLKAQMQNSYGTYEGSSGAFFPQPGFFNVSGSGSPVAGSSTAANSFASTTMEWEIFSFGKRQKDNEAAKSLTHKTLSEKEAYLLQLKKILSERYINLLYNDAKLNLSQRNTERLDSIRRITTGLSAAGLRPAADSLLASSSYVQAMGEYDKWNGVKSASFIKLLELYGGDSVDFSASAIRFIDPLGNQQNNGSIIQASHPIFEALDRESEYYTLSGEAQKRASLPSFNLLGGYAYRGTGIQPDGRVSGNWKDGFSNSTNNFLVGVGITWNLTSIRTNHFKGEQLFKEAEGVKLLHSQYEKEMQANLSSAQTEILNQFEQLKKTKLAVKQSQDAYSMYLARYKSGLITLSELLQVRTLLEQSENIHIQASRDYWLLLASEAALTADFEFLFNNL